MCISGNVFCFISVVEQIDSSASLYGQSIQDHDVCLLVKQTVSILSVHDILLLISVPIQYCRSGICSCNLNLSITAEGHSPL